ncbi:DUF262 domain-containing protein [Mesorhizobium sp. M7A.F.Ca.MR.148.00.0.0]|uniref:DUF262 domain-containing protein n=1 Tax=Mesorhizobium sp. M7A.F.Ca.MR.148.00.0.0 TaxID=2496775 RepID=UPI000FCBE669|nr:DUF262 domain-containing protein [Mesorhizobium sp. M7A.F.Ca.MR.148.00.0.0]RUV37524.1 DUF262 domain-containing protein [Mesorhizobium sp. M7A.F.Ca.MR.148.00.0.0]
MEARPCQISEFFNGTKQLLVPLFQRPYEWGSREWQSLWDDLLEQYERSEEDTLASHFTGAVVTAPAKSVPVGVSKYLVIDGQQRLTTVAILITSIRSFFDRHTPKYRKLTRLLVNEDDDGLDYFKLLPTQPDRSAFQGLVQQSPVLGTRFTQAYEFFRQKLSSTDSDGVAIDLERLSDAVQTRLTVVAIHLGDVDDPYLIFESLNAKGAPLTQADLIRNYLLLRLHSNDQQTAYETAWLPMQSLLSGDHLTEFMRHFLMLSGDEVAKSAIYSVLKRRLLNVEDSSVFAELQRMERSSVLYAQIVGLTQCPDEDIARGLERLRRWDISTANTLILKMLERYREGATDAKDISDCLQIIESFAVRRQVCAVPTNQLKRIFISSAKDVPESGIAHWLGNMLASGSSGRRWPKDDEFMQGLLRYRAYAQPLDRCKFLLEAIEHAAGHKEPAAFHSATIEHIMPQTLTAEWNEMLGPSFVTIHERWLDLLPNLTLTAYNSELSNSPFAVKRTLLADSHFELNKWVSARQNWTEYDLEQRAGALFEVAKDIWRGPIQQGQ